MRSDRVLAGLMVFGAIALLALNALAQAPTAATSALAEALFEQARDLFKAERYAEACVKFEVSERLEPKLGTLLRLALCHEKIGKTATAWAEYTTAATIAHREHQDEREAFARERIDALGALIPHLVIKAPNTMAGLVVTLDDNRVDETLWNEPLPIDPGRHTLSAAAPGKKEWSLDFEVPRSKADVPVEIPTLLDVQTPTPKTDEAPPPVSPSPPANPATTTPIALTLLPAPPSVGVTIAYVGFGVGAAGLLLGTMTGSFAWARSGPLLAACPGGKCPETQRDALDAVDTLANLSNIGFGLGIAGASTGIVGLVLASQAHPSRASFSPQLGPSWVGLSGTF